MGGGDFLSHQVEQVPEGGVVKANIQTLEWRILSHIPRPWFSSTLLCSLAAIGAPRPCHQRLPRRHLHLFGAALLDMSARGAGVDRGGPFPRLGIAVLVLAVALGKAHLVWSASLVLECRRPGGARRHCVRPPLTAAGAGIGLLGSDDHKMMLNNNLWAADMW